MITIIIIIIIMKIIIIMIILIMMLMITIIIIMIMMIISIIEIIIHIPMTKPMNHAFKASLSKYPFEHKNPKPIFNTLIGQNTLSYTRHRSMLSTYSRPLFFSASGNPRPLNLPTLAPQQIYGWKLEIVLVSPFSPQRNCSTIPSILRTDTANTINQKLALRVGECFAILELKKHFFAFECQNSDTGCEVI